MIFFFLFLFPYAENTILGWNFRSELLTQFAVIAEFSHLLSLFFKELKGTWKDNLPLLSVLILVFTFYRHKIKEHIFADVDVKDHWNTDVYYIFAPAGFTPYFLYHWCTTHL